MLDEQIIKDTEIRFAERQGPLEAISFAPASPGSLLGANSPEEIARRMQRLGVDPETLPTAGDATSFGITGTEVGSAPIVSPLERILDQNDLLRVGFLEGGVSVARSVGRINIRDAGGRTVGFGTGFMVSPRLVMTNNHVLAAQRDAGSSQVEFNFQDDVTGKPLPTVTFDLKPEDFFVTDRPLDYTLVAVSPRSRDGRELAEFGWQRLVDDEGGVLKGELVNIVQHPGGQPKMLALRENQVVDLLEQFLHYRTDTEPGSSGSPVYNDQWQIVALHHSGVPRRDAQGRILARDGTVWRPAMGENRIDWSANEGVRIGRVLQHLGQQTLGSPQRALRAEVFEAAPVGDRSPTNRPLGSGGTSMPGGVRREATVQGPQDGSMVQQPDGSVTWTIPLQVNIRLGAPVMTGTPAIGGATPGSQPVVPPSGPGEPSEEPELQQALAELEAARQKPYYDAAADRRDRDTYYAGLPGSLTPAKFFDRLRDLLKSTHKRALSYRPSVHVYPLVDLQPNLKLRSIYSGKEFAPEELIREDFRIERERTARLRELFQAESTVGPERLQEEIDLLEAQSPFNCEHVVPQSWFGKREPMRGDLHHLFACESDCNSFRGNTPYFDFEDFEEAVRTDCGKREGNRFEPEAGKGAVARATLYFLIRYPGEINAAAKELEEERLRILLHWHQDHEVTEYERHRNQAIFAKQGNRNPLIDSPEWASKIDFRRGLG